MLLEVIEHLDYDTYKSFLVECSEDPEFAEQQMQRFIEIVEKHLDEKEETEFEKFALIYCGFDCDVCGDYECADPSDFKKTAKAAEEKGWGVTPDGFGEWKVRCPNHKLDLKNEN